jgi:putative DNA primase/helicase
MKRLTSKATSVSSRAQRAAGRKAKASSSDSGRSKQKTHRDALLKEFPHTDLGNARHLVSRHGKELRYCPAWGKWLVWDGKRWAIDKTYEIERRAKETVFAMRDEAKAVEDEDRRDKFQQHCRRSQSAARLEAMCKLARSEAKIVITPDKLDPDPWLLNCGNGTLDLKIGRFRPHLEADLITKITPVNFSDSAKCPVFEHFLERVTDGDEELAHYLQRCVGYCLTGLVSEKALFFLLGDGDNGKTTFLEAIRYVFGEYAGQIPIESFLRKNNNGIPNDVAQLQKLRFVTSSEVPEGRSLDESKIKYMTGMGTIQARFLYGELFEFQPSFKLFIDSNRKPKVAGDEKAVWNRIRVIPFNATIPESEKDKNLLEKLKSEAEGILAWAVRGCHDWKVNGLPEPAVVKNASQEYREEMDTVSRFLPECCDLGQDFSERSGDLYTAYSMWCSREGEQPESKLTFGKYLGRRSDFQPQKIGGERGWQGIKLKSGSSLRGALRPAV